MMAHLGNYLHFNGHCAEAMTFYQSCLGGVLTLQKISESPIADQCPAGVQDQILHGTLHNGSLMLMASDMIAPGKGYRLGNHMALSLTCDSEEQLRTLFDSLSAGGEIIDPVRLQFWGAVFGVFEDRYGFRWMLNYQLPA